nr:MAG TPA: hypothetical protein [Caudoviricetes sp.]
MQFARAVFFCPTVVSSQLSCCGKSQKQSTGY